VKTGRDDRALAAVAESTLQGKVEPVGEPLRAPASGVPCVHWRLRIFEHLAPGMEFVHDVVSPDPIELAWRREPELPVARVRLAPDTARLHASPVLFRAGTPGALAVAQQFGLRGQVRVEEVIIRPGEAVEATGMLADPAAALSRGPFRTIDAPLELLSATLRLETGLSLRPVLLPWALSAVAALLGTAGVATVMQWWEGHARRLPSPGAPADIGARKLLRPHWP
jgi:hypothetical protein